MLVEKCNTNLVTAKLCKLTFSKDHHFCIFFLLFSLGFTKFERKAKFLLNQPLGQISL